MRHRHSFKGASAAGESQLLHTQKCRPRFLCGKLIVLLFDDVQAVSENLQTHRFVQSWMVDGYKLLGVSVFLFFYLPGVLRHNDSIVPESAGGEESRALLRQSLVQVILLQLPLLLLFLLLLTVRGEQRARVTRSCDRHFGVGPQEQEVRVKGPPTLERTRFTLLRDEPCVSKNLTK